MALRYLSLCSGIEAATVAWEPLGWLPVAFAEVEKFPSAVLAHHYPSVPNLGDITQISGKDFRGKIDLIVGGTPCQSYSVAGRRKGLDDPRGELTLVFLEFIGKARPQWFIWENVPGVLSVDGGRTFGTILGQMAKFGYRFAWRVLDAQHFGVPQRRRRLYLVGHLGNWRPAAAVLFERHCLSRHTPPRRKTGKEVAGTLTSRSRSGGWSQDVDLAAGGYMQVSPSVISGAPFSKTGNARVETEALVVSKALTTRMESLDPTMEKFILAIPLQEVGKRTGISTNDPRAGIGIGSVNDPMFTLQAGAQHGVAHTLRGEGFDASEDGTGRANLIPINLQVATRHNALGERTALGIGQEGDPAFTLTKTHSHGVFIDAQAASVSECGGTVAVRRLTPKECERLQGFPDDYTLIPWRGKPAALCPDGPRYKALGNSMAVPVMRWLGERIIFVEKLMAVEAA